MYQYPLMATRLFPRNAMAPSRPPPDMSAFVVTAPVVPSAVDRKLPFRLIHRVESHGSYAMVCAMYPPCARTSEPAGVVFRYTSLPNTYLVSATNGSGVTCAGAAPEISVATWPVSRSSWYVPLVTPPPDTSATTVLRTRRG